MKEPHQADFVAPKLQVLAIPPRVTPGLRIVPHGVGVCIRAVVEAEAGVEPLQSGVGLGEIYVRPEKNGLVLLEAFQRRQHRIKVLDAVTQGLCGPAEPRQNHISVPKEMACKFRQCSQSISHAEFATPFIQVCGTYAS